ncbi:MAG TPA: VOC family protein [Spongiibacteraceae bacterium]|nr:VOC family protein [Spongiibacteraceae bacterium]
MAIHELFAYLRVDDANKAIDFYRAAFDATEKFRLVEPSGRIGHAELDFNGKTLMLSDEFPEYGMHGPNAGNSGAVTLHLHVDDADAVLQQAVAAGAKLEMAAQDHFYGERSGSVIDPFGHRWSIGHSIEALTPEEMQRRYTELLQQ